MQRIFVGDVQGCSDELHELVERATETFGDEFSLFVAGDLINRGPDNLGPLELVRGLVEAGRAEYVLGNHEINLLAVQFGLRDLSPNDSISDILDAPDASDWVDWIRGRPLAVSGEIADQHFAMLHAAADPDWSLDDLLDRAARVEARLSGPIKKARAFLAADPEADPDRDALGRLTRCRSVPAEGTWSSRDPETPDQAWHRVWASRQHDYGIVYGHWARQGLHVDIGLRGLDTGCVHHGRGRDGFLTAWLPDSNSSRGAQRPFDTPDDRFWQIPAARRYYDPV